MSATAAAPARPAPSPANVLHGEAGYQAFMLLRLAFTVAPIAFGLDKFFGRHGRLAAVPRPVDQRHPARRRARRDAPRRRRSRSPPAWPSPSSRATARRWSPRWLFGIIINLLTLSGYYDVALRDFGLMLGALTLARLAWAYDRREAPADRH